MPPQLHCDAARGSFTVFVLPDEAELEGQDCEHAHPEGNRDAACCVRGVVPMLRVRCVEKRRTGVQVPLEQ